MITTTLIIFLLNKKYNEDIEDFIIEADEDEKKKFSKIDLLKQFVVIFANSLLFFIPVGFQD